MITPLSPSTAYKPTHGGYAETSLFKGIHLYPYQRKWIEALLDSPGRSGCAACDRGNHQLGHHHLCPKHKP